MDEPIELSVCQRNDRESELTKQQRTFEHACLANLRECLFTLQALPAVRRTIGVLGSVGSALTEAIFAVPMAALPTFE